MQHKTISINDLRKAVSEFTRHRTWYKILVAYKLRPLWTTAELRNHLKLPHTKNILATSEGTLRKLGYVMVPVNKNTKGSKYYLKKIKQ